MRVRTIPDAASCSARCGTRSPTGATWGAKSTTSVSGCDRAHATKPAAVSSAAVSAARHRWRAAARATPHHRRGLCAGRGRDLHQGSNARDQSARWLMQPPNRARTPQAVPPPAQGPLRPELKGHIVLPPLKACLKRGAGRAGKASSHSARGFPARGTACPAWGWKPRNRQARRTVLLFRQAPRTLRASSCPHGWTPFRQGWGSTVSRTGSESTTTPVVSCTWTSMMC